MVMKNRRSGVVEDIWMNTQVDPDDYEPISPAGHEDHDHSGEWIEIEEENIMLNPDMATMDRG